MIRILAAMDSRAFFGAERANLEVLWRMQECGAEVTALVRDEDWPENLHMRMQLDQRGIAWIKAPFPDYPSSRYKRYWPRVFLRNPGAFVRLNAVALRTIAERKITNLHISTPFQALSLAWAMSRSKVPATFFCNAEPSRHNLLYRRTWRWMSGRIDGFVCESKYMRGVVAAAGIDCSKIAVIPSAPPRRMGAAPFTAKPSAKCAKPTVFGFVGQLTAQKGIVVLLEALALVAAQHPEVQLLLAGPAEEPFARTLVAHWSEFGSVNQVQFCGAVEDILGFMAACDVHVAPSLGTEAYGLVVIEAKQSGLPSIVFDSGGMAELIAHGEDGLIAPEKTVAALAEQMLVYADDAARARADGARARASLNGRLEIEQQDEKWIAAYKLAQVERHQCDANREAP